MHGFIKHSLFISEHTQTIIIHKLASSIYTYFDPKTARESVDCGRILWAWFEAWARVAL